jgi:hypothetical protein
MSHDQVSKHCHGCGRTQDNVADLHPTERGPLCRLCVTDPDPRGRWLARWPAHCKTCEGWGGSTFYESHGFTHGPAEAIFEPCPDCVDHEVPHCGRCSFPLTVMDDDSVDHCGACGWNLDDGAPDVDFPFDD